jgi:hypothetical protein
MHHSDRAFEAIFGHSRELHATLLNEVNEVGAFALAIDFLIILIAGRASTSADLYEQAVSVDLIGPKCRLHNVPLRREHNTLSHRFAVMPR